MGASGSGPDIFLSYRRSDRELAGELVAALERRGPSVWWDADIAGGDDWRDTIIEQLSAARCLVILFSESCNTSKQLKKELAVADHLDKEVIPVLIEPTEPRGFFLYELASRQWISIHPSPRQKLDVAAGLLLERLGEMGWSPPPAPSPAPARPLPPPSLDTPALRPPAPPTSMPTPPRGRLRDMFPFRWYDLVLPTLLVVLALAADSEADAGVELTGGVFLFVSVLALTGLIVFPIRYYRRGVNPRRVVGGLIAMNATFAVVAAIAGSALSEAAADAGAAPEDEAGQVALGAIAIGIGIAVVSFVVFLVLSKARARRAYRASLVRV